MNTAVAAENYFRTRTGDSTSDANIVAQNYLKNIYSATLESEGAPEPPMPPVDPSPEAMDKYNSAVVAWTNENTKAIGKAKAAVNQVKEAVGKGQFDLADKLVSNQGTKVKVGGEEYRAYTAKAREGVAALESLKPVIEGIKTELQAVSKSQTPDYAGIKLMIPQVARVMAMSMNPGSDVSMGSIAEAEASTHLGEAEKAGFNMPTAIAMLAGFLEEKKAGKDVSFIDYMVKFGEKQIEAVSPQAISKKLSTLIHHAEEAGNAYRKANLIGYGTPEPKKSPEKGDESDKGWRDRPAKKDDKKPSTSTERKPGESYADYLRRTKK
jgi:hypothetical protein